MSGSSVSSSWSARMPSKLTTVVETPDGEVGADQVTMLGSSSTTRAQVLRPSSSQGRHDSPPLPVCGVGAGAGAGVGRTASSHLALVPAGSR